MLSICTGIGRISLRRISASPIGMELADVVDTLNQISPLKFAEEWDNVGLLVEPSAPHKVKSIMLTNDLTIEVMNESIEANADMIVSYHPPIFRSLKRITAKSWKERLVVSALENRIAIYSPHTASDAVQNGVNDWLASGIAEAMEVRPIKCKTQPGLGGILGLQSVACDSLPSLQKHFGSDIQIVKKSPTGTIAFLSGTYNLCHDFQKLGIPRNNVIHVPNSEQTISDAGAGRLCTLEHAITLEVIIEKLKHHLKLKHLRLALGLGKSLKSSIRTVGLCAGSGSSVLAGCEADLYITGEMSHHDVLDATQNGVSVILCEHSNSERGYLHHLKTVLIAHLQRNDMNIIISSKDRDPLVQQCQTTSTNCGKTATAKKFKAENLNCDFMKLYTNAEANQVFCILEDNVTYNTGAAAKVQICGKWMDIPRKQTAYGDVGTSYRFSGNTISAKPWLPCIKNVKKKVEAALEDRWKFNFVLVNRYENGCEYIGEHRDDEIDLDRHAPIASVSFGQERDFVFRHKDARGKTKTRTDLKSLTISLTNGSLLVMNPPTNDFWYHSLPVRKRALLPRINLTFRVMANTPT